jgi:hypothetical protein
MQSRTTSTLARADAETKRMAPGHGTAIPELERSPFPQTIEPDRTGVVVSSGRANRRIIRRRVSPLTVLLSLFIAVGNLLAEIDTLERQHSQILMDRERLQFEIRQLSSLEHIQNRAQSELDLKVVREAPTWLAVDKDKIRALEDEAAAQKP